MKPEEIDRVLDVAVNRAVPPAASADAIERVNRALLSDLSPVRPMAAGWVFALAFVALFILFAGLGGVALGVHGIHALAAWQQTAIFPVLLVTASLAAVACAREMRPSGGLHLGLSVMLLAAAGFAVLFSLIFRGFGTQSFAREGIPCLLAGLGEAIPVGLTIVYILRRGFVLDWSMAGAASGALSGLTGLAMLEIHCPNLKAIHVVVWHVGVVVVSGAVGYALGFAAKQWEQHTGN